jgi:hypothetical protein
LKLGRQPRTYKEFLASPGGGFIYPTNRAASVGDARRWVRRLCAKDALQRAKRFLKLGFVVYAIKDPNGATFMDEVQIADHFAPREPLVIASDGRSVGNGTETWGANLSPTEGAALVVNLG